jgi:hypothetical protein
LRASPQYVFQHVLRHPLRFFGVEIIPRATTAQRIIEASDERPVHASGKHHCRWTVRRDRRGVPKRVGYAPASQVLTAAYIGRFRARAIADPIVTFHNDAAHAPLAKLDCGGKPNRTGTDYQYIGFHIDLGAHVLRRSLGRWQANVSRYRVRQEVAGADRFL